MQTSLFCYFAKDDGGKMRVLIVLTQATSSLLSDKSVFQCILHAVKVLYDNEPHPIRPARTLVLSKLQNKHADRSELRTEWPKSQRTIRLETPRKASKWAAAITQRQVTLGAKEPLPQRR